MRLRRRTQRLATLADQRRLDDDLICLADRLGVDPAVLRIDALAVHERLLHERVVTLDDHVAWLARDLDESPDRIRRELAEIGRLC